METQEPAFQSERHRHLGFISILIDILINYKNGRAGQKITGGLLILSCLAILAFKVLFIIIIWTMPFVVNQSVLPMILVVGILIFKEITRFYEIEVIHESNFYSTKIYFFAFVDWLQINLFHNFVVFLSIRRLSLLSVDSFVIGIMTVAMTEIEHFFTQKYFSNETDISNRFIKRSLIPMPYIMIVFIIHFLWIIGLIILTIFPFIQ